MKIPLPFWKELVNALGNRLDSEEIMAEDIKKVTKYIKPQINNIIVMDLRFMFLPQMYMLKL